MVDLVNIGYRADTNDLLRADQRMKMLARTGGELDQNVRGLTGTIGKLGAAFALLGAGAVIGKAISAAKEFNQSIADLSAITGAAGKDLEFYRKNAAEIGRTTSLSASQAATAFKLIASAKPDLLESAEALNAVTREAVTLAEATGMALPEAATAMATAMNQFQLDSSKANEVINVLAASSKLGTASVASVSEAMRNAGSAANSLGIDLTETVAGIQALAAAGREGSDAGTALRQVMLRLEATGEKDLMPSINGLTKSLNVLKGRNLDNTELMKLFGQEAFTAATSLLAQSDIVEKLNVNLRGTATATEQAKIRMNTLTGDMLALNSALEGLQIAVFGNEVDGLARSLAQAATGGVNTLTDNLDALAAGAKAAGIVIGAGLTIAIGKSLGAMALQIVATQQAAKAEMLRTAAITATTRAELIAIQTAAASVPGFYLNIQAKTALTAAETAYASALTVSTAAAGKAAIATNVLGAAVKFALGPIGLLITAIGIGISVYSDFKEEADEVKRTLEKQNKVLSDNETLWMLHMNQIRRDASAELVGKSQAEIQKAFSQTTVSLKKHEEALIKMQETAADSQLKDALRQTIIGEKAILSDITKLLDAYTKKSIDMRKEREKSAEASQKIEDSFQGQTQSLADMITELSLTREQYELYGLQMDAIASDLTPQMISALEAQLEAYQNLRAEKEMTLKKEESAKQEKEDLDELIKSVENFGGAWSRTGSQMTDAFGTMADVLNDFGMEMESIIKLQTELNLEKEKAIATGQDTSKIEKSLMDLDKKSTSAQLGGMAAISKTFGSMFKEQSKGREAMNKAEQVFTAIEIGLALQKASANALTAISSAFAAPFPVGFAAGAAMIAIMASLGLFGGGGGGGSVPSAADMQATQGTGTVLGDPTGKSESIINAMESFEDVAIDQLHELRAIRNAMSNLSAGIANLAVSLVRSPNFGGGNAGSLGTSRSFEGNELTDLLTMGVLGTAIDKLTGGFVGGIMDSIIGGISKKTRTLIASGISFNTQEMGDLIATGLMDASYFNVIKTVKKRLWGLSRSSSTSIEFSDIELPILEEFGKIFMFIGDAITGALDVLGVDPIIDLNSSANNRGRSRFDNEDIFTDFDFGDAFDGIGGAIGEGVERSLDNFVIDIGDVSFEGLSGEEIQAELESIFSQQADLMAEYMFPALEQFQQMGEGSFETLMRLAREQAIFNDTLDNLGLTLGDMSNFMRIEVAQSIIGLIGGLDNFTDAVGSYFDAFFTDEQKMEVLLGSLTDVFGDLNFSMPMTREGFKALVESLDLSTLAGQEAFAALMELSPAMDQYLSAIEREAELKEKEAERLAKQGQSLQINLLKALGQSEEALALQRQMELDALDESLHAIALQIFAAEDATRAEAERTSAINSAMTMINNAVRAEIEIIKELEKQAKERLTSATEALKKSFEFEKNQIKQASNIRIEGLRSEIRLLESARTAAQQFLSSATDDLNKAFEAEKNKITSAAEAAEEAAKLESEARQLQIEKLTEAAQASREFSASLFDVTNTIMSAVDNMAVSSDRLTLARRRSAQNEIDLAISRAQSGDFSNALNIDSSLSALSNTSGLFSSAEDLAFDVAKTQHQLSKLAGLTETKATSEQLIAEGFDATIASLESIKEQSAINSDAEIQSLDDQLNAILGIDTSVLSISQAIAQYNDAMSQQSNFDEQIELINDQILAEETATQQQLDVLDNQLNELLEIDDSVVALNDAISEYLSAQNDLLEADYQSQIDGLNNLSELMQAQVNAALGIDTSVLSVLEAVNALNEILNPIVEPIVEPEIPIAPIQIIINRPPPTGQTPPIIFDHESLEPIVTELRSLRSESQAANLAIAKSSQTTAKILQRLELDGLDTRVIV